MTPAPDADPRLSLAELALLLGVTRRLARPFALPEMLAEVTAAACGVLHAERASVWMLDAEAGALELRVSSDIGPLRIAVGQGLVGACARDRALINVPDCYADPRFDASVDRSSGFRTRCSLTLPLSGLDGALVGVMQVLNKQGGVFGPADEVLAEALAAQCAVALARARLTERVIEAEKLRQELALARVVQTSALPRTLPEVPGYEMHAVFRPAGQTGGDTYDLARVGDELLVVLADASGHGVAPALSVTQMQALLRMGFRMGGRLETVFREVNDHLSEVLPDGHFVTAFVGLLDPATHRLRFLSGGQAPILLHAAADGSFRHHNATSFPMGAMPLPADKPAVTETLAPGDLLALLSDGIYEHESPARNAFGREGVEQCLRARAGEPLEAVADGILRAMNAFGGGAPQQDDVTMVLLRRRATA